MTEYRHPWWLRALYWVDRRAFRCRWIWFCDWVHHMQDIRRLGLK